MASSQDIGVCFVLFDFKSRDAPEDLIACLLAHLVRRRRVPQNLRDLFYQYATRPKGSRPLIEELASCLRTTVSSYSRVFVVIDALDECEVGTRTVFLETMFDLQKTTNTYYLLATMRPIEEIMALFAESQLTLHRVHIDAKDNDIRQFLGCRIAQRIPFLRRVPEHTREELISDISKASTGV